MACYGETLSTLKFAQRAKLVKNEAVVNEDATGSIFALKQEVNRLKDLLEIALAQERIISGETEEQRLDRCAQNLQSSDFARQERESILQRLLKHVEVVDEDKKFLSKKLEALMEYCESLKSSLHAKEMITKLQQEKIQKLIENVSVPEQEFQKEIDLLRSCLENNSEAQRLKIENQDLIGTVRGR